jgi:hypothetical protein
MTRSRTLRTVLALTLAASTAAAQAQLRLPSVSVPLPQRIAPLDTEVLRNTGERLLHTGNLPVLRDLRLDQVGRLLRQHRDVLEADPRGEPVVRHEILAWSPSPAALDAARAAGWTVLRERTLDGIGATMVVLGVPGHLTTAAALEQLRALDPEGAYDFNHVYTGSAAAPIEGGQAAAQHATQAGKAGPHAVGLVDSGVDTGHAVFRGADIRRWGCGDAPRPSAHGTAVAALMVGRSERFRGVAPHASLYAADVYCDSGTGGSADKIATALAWLAGERVAVINVSLVGPPNKTLELAVGAMVKRGHLLVAAVGNDGPAAAPLYPASYPGVVGVSAVDRQGRALPEAARGPQVMFAAPGHQMVSAAIGAPPYRIVRGTSFAAPIVAALLAEQLERPDPAAARMALQALTKQAVRADANAVSNETGYGVLGATLRNDPSAFR